MGENGIGRITPAMKQYFEIKGKYPDCIVLFRMGDFYETFYDDAKIVSRDLQIVLTARGKDDARAPLAGIPFHSLDTYLKKLIDKGHKVVIVEQLEDPKFAKGIVKRGVVRVITPGTIVEPHLIDERTNNYIVSIYPAGNVYGICACDISTGEVQVSEVKADELETEFEKFRPREVLVPEGLAGGYSWLEGLETVFQFKRTGLDLYKFDENNGQFLLSRIVGSSTFAAYGLDDAQYARRALSGLLAYLHYTVSETGSIRIHKISKYTSGTNMCIDATTIRNLDLISNQADGTTRNTLLSCIDKTVTPMGSRMLRRWLTSPLGRKQDIEERLDNVEQLHSNPLNLDRLRETVSAISDLERIATRITYRTALPRELLVLAQSLARVAQLKRQAEDYGLAGRFFTSLMLSDHLEQVQQVIVQAIDENAKQVVRDGGIIRAGYSSELDSLRSVISNSQQWIERFELEERERTGIKTLKVRYNKVIGYYIEIPKTQESKVPPEYVRKQTQLNSERYISPKLKETEAMVLTAEEKAIALEQELYDKLLEYLAAHANKIYALGSLVAECDCYLALARTAYENRYVRPKITESGPLVIRDGRHPVVEKNVADFVPNSVRFDDSCRIMIITGPNMAGKSTVMRQVALISILAHIGSFVPAAYAEIPIIDRVFTRVGARDDIARGQSTFMTEMIESANILNNATERSLVILDEIGRGTSTYDGMAIAWSIIEHIAEKIRCKAMFATHYHLMNMLAVKYPFVRNYNVAVDESGDKVVFLHKLVEGGTDKSYGTHVARLAGLPTEVVERAKTISKSLEENDFLHRETLNRLTHGKNEGLRKNSQTSIGSWSV